MTGRQRAARIRRFKRLTERQRSRVLLHVIDADTGVDVIRLRLPDWIERLPTRPGSIRVRIDERKVS